MYILRPSGLKWCVEHLLRSLIEVRMSSEKFNPVAVDVLCVLMGVQPGAWGILKIMVRCEPTRALFNVNAGLHGRKERSPRGNRHWTMKMRRRKTFD